MADKMMTFQLSRIEHYSKTILSWKMALLLQIEPQFIFSIGEYKFFSTFLMLKMFINEWTIQIFYSIEASF